jgi:uncharacterized repeat protein (TIGR01451 family)
MKGIGLVATVVVLCTTLDLWSQESVIPSDGHQFQGVTLDWIGSPRAQIGQSEEYTLLVRNVAPEVVYSVVVNVKLPENVTAASTTPQAKTDGKVLIWQLGNMLPRQEKKLHVCLVSHTKGDITPTAWVSFTSIASAMLHIHVHEPKLTLKATCPEKVIAGDSVTFQLGVSNNGDGPADQVKIRASLAPGLEHPGDPAASASGSAGKEVDFELGNLGVGESRLVQLVCTAKAAGKQTCSAVAETKGEFKAQVQAAVLVLAPNLDLQIVGPAVRYLDRKANYTFRVTNRGDIPATNVTVREVIPPGFKFTAASKGGSYDVSNQTVCWYLGELAPGQGADVQVDLVAVAPGQHLHRATACTERGVKIQVERELLTRVDDLSALLLQIKDSDDPVEVGKETTYEILVTNAGSKMETGIRLLCAVPPKMEVMTGQGPTRFHAEGNLVSFEPVAKLAPRGDAVFRIRVKALAPGDVRFKAQVTSVNLPEPVVQVESTQIYSDQP